jgi:hypothetical protein
MKLSTMAKQMKLKNGKVYVSFGKEDKLYIGTYVDTESHEDIQDSLQEDPAAEEVIKFTADKSLHGFGKSVWINDNRNVNNTMTYFNPKGKESITIHIHPNNYDRYWNIENFIYSIMKEHGNNPLFWNILIEELHNKYVQNKLTHVTNKPKYKEKTIKKEEIIEKINKINMTASYAQINYIGDQVLIIFTNEKESNTITFNYRKSWSHRKYIDKALELSGVTPSWEFRYGWEMEAIS